MKEQIRQRARELGFDDCRFTSARPPTHASQFKEWLAQQRHGAMGYLQRNAHKRVQPQLVLPDAQSIITLAASYAEEPRATAAPAPCSPSGRSPRVKPGLVARYARFTDYHDVLTEPLTKLSEYIQQLGGPAIRCLCYVDTGPLLERDLAERAGLGFIGKHTN